MAGRQNWYSPDAEPTPPGSGELRGNECVIVLSPDRDPATVRVTLRYVDREPERYSFEVAAERVRCLCTDVPADAGGHVIPLDEHYAISRAPTCR